MLWLPSPLFPWLAVFQKAALPRQLLRALALGRRPPAAVARHVCHALCSCAQSGNTALMIATRKSDLPLSSVDMLIKAGAALDLQNKDGNTALILATNRQDASLVDMLIKAGAALDLQNKASSLLPRRLVLFPSMLCFCVFDTYAQ
jgi:hypothetical protein